MHKHISKKLILFIILVLILTGLFAFSMKIFHVSQTPLTALMVFPMLLALIFMLVSKERFSNVGWKLPPVKFIFISIFLPILQLGVILAIEWSSRLVTFNNQHFITSNPTPDLRINLVLCIPAMFIPYLLLSPIPFLIGWINHLGEEFVWRGYLFRKIIEESRSIMTGVLISGLTWWAWHLPMFWLSPELNRLNWAQIFITLILSAFSLLGTAIIYSWIYFKSGSIWAPTIMHVFWNLYRGILTGRLSDSSTGLFDGDLWLINGEGIIGMAVTALTGLCFLPLILKIDRSRKFQ